ncbi:CehA/McbA family metallohydrolase [Streptomyces catenulae]|uniref:CehA/McbA family metallohydrolase n=1 Tax=Streptomyces catenulae TaxID=66875 RepID=A0ABV2Z475_9ACTN|nr:CehA/McbA family metallohydrolase [Streptomyces catenulae]
MERREVLKLSAATGTAGALALGPVRFAAATPAPGGDGGSDGGDTLTRTVGGHLPPGAPDHVYVPIEVPPGVRELAVAYRYDRPDVPDGTVGNACDIGIFDERGTAPGGPGFRGWSGGARSSFFLRADDATPGYLPGPVCPGTWHLALGPYTLAPQGLSYEITVTLRLGAPGRTPPPVYPPERARGRGRAWYRGDGHLHSVHSDGRRTPAEIAALARAARLDFINTSEHNTTSSHRAWEGLWGDDLLILTGEEITTRNGHLVALGTDPGAFLDWRRRARDTSPGAYARAVHRVGGLAIPAHPHASCIGCSWKFGLDGADAVEVWNGPYTAEDETALAAWDGALVAHARGDRPRWLPAVGHSDAHRDPDVIGLPQTVVLADDLSRHALQDGIRAGRVWIAESADIDLSFDVSGARGEHAGIGGHLLLDGGAAATARLTVSGAPGCTATFHTDQGTLHSAPIPPGGPATLTWTTSAERAAYVRAEVRHPADSPGTPGRMAALTNPVFLGVRGGGGR